MQWFCVCRGPCCGFSFLLKGDWQAQLEKKPELGEIQESKSMLWASEKEPYRDVTCLSSDEGEEVRNNSERVYRNSAVWSGIGASGFSCLLWLIKTPEGVIWETVWLHSWVTEEANYHKTLSESCQGITRTWVCDAVHIYEGVQAAVSQISRVLLIAAILGRKGWCLLLLHIFI